MVPCSWQPDFWRRHFAAPEAGGYTGEFLATGTLNEERLMIFVKGLGLLPQ